MPGITIGNRRGGVASRCRMSSPPDREADDTALARTPEQHEAVAPQDAAADDGRTAARLVRRREGPEPLAGASVERRKHAGAGPDDGHPPHGADGSHALPGDVLR